MKQFCARNELIPNNKVFVQLSLFALAPHLNMFFTSIEFKTFATNTTLKHGFLRSEFCVLINGRNWGNTHVMLVSRTNQPQQMTIIHLEWEELLTEGTTKHR